MVWRFAKANESKGKKRWSEKKTEENTIKTYAYFNKIFFFASCCYIRCVRGAIIIRFGESFGFSFWIAYWTIFFFCFFLHHFCFWIIFHFCSFYQHVYQFLWHFLFVSLYNLIKMYTRYICATAAVHNWIFVET